MQGPAEELVKADVSRRGGIDLAPTRFELSRAKKKGAQANSYNAHFFFTFFFFIADSFFFLFAFFLGPYSERNFFNFL